MTPSPPFCIRTALAKKWHSPLWYNMYYASSLPSYEEDLWRHALGGGRMNFHPLWPHPWEGLTTSLLAGPLLAADCRVRLLNFISTAPIDCPVAVVFSHPRVVNWATPGWGDAGVSICDALWKDGYYADLIPSSEIASGALRLADDGRIAYGPQRYAAVVFDRPQYERPAAAGFFGRAAAAGKTSLYRVGEWTLDFEGHPVDVQTALPAGMKSGSASECVGAIIAQLKAGGVEPQTPCTLRGAGGFPASMMPRPSGQCRLLDGTVILAAGEIDVEGDPIRKTVQVNGHEVAFDAVGVAGARLDHEGRVEALAAGALKSFRGGGLAIELPERIDVALWRDANGRWHGVLQDWTGAVPPALAAITADWQRLVLPAPFTP